MAESTTIESGVAFADETDADVSVTATFIQAGEQLQHVFIGLEPVILVQPEYDSEAHSVEFVVTAVDLTPPGLVEVLELLLDSAKQMVEQDMAILEQRQQDVPVAPEELHPDVSIDSEGIWDRVRPHHMPESEL